MKESKKSGYHLPFSFMMALSLATVATPSVTMAQAQVAALETKPAEIRIVSTEFRFSPTTVLIAAGRAVTLVLDNRGAETEHGLFVPGLGFRLQAKAGEIARKNILVEKPGKYDYDCDLPGHRDAGMTGTLIVVDR